VCKTYNSSACKLSEHFYEQELFNNSQQKAPHASTANQKRANSSNGEEGLSTSASSKPQANIIADVRSWTKQLGPVTPLTEEEEVSPRRSNCLLDSYLFLLRFPSNHSPLTACSSSSSHHQRLVIFGTRDAYSLASSNCLCGAQPQKYHTKL
jgi:hypothetical protein